GDGRVSQEEYVAWMGYAFERMDRDGDGVLSPGEQPRGKGRPLSLQEHRRRLAERFVRQDANGDGYLAGRASALPPRRRPCLRACAAGDRPVAARAAAATA